MALTPTDEIHALQIQAGALGRKAGHAFEDEITTKLNTTPLPFEVDETIHNHVLTGSPSKLLLNYISSSFGGKTIESLVGISTGALATSEEGKKWLSVNGVKVRRCKSDLIITLKFNDEEQERTFGVSTKQCNNKTPTNAQLYFTTAVGFSNLLITNGISVSDRAIMALRQFCGDKGFRPYDDPKLLANRTTDPRRYFWEEIDSEGRNEWTNIFTEHQDAITRLLLQKAYLEDPFSPDFVLHKTKRAASWSETEVAIYSIDELTDKSRQYSGFWTKSYSVRKGSFKDPTGISHEAPRFGVVQMQRGGQKQHPEQLQFNLEAGYFYKIGQDRT